GKWFLRKEIFAKSLEHKKIPTLHDDTWFTPEWIGTPVEAQQVKDLINHKSGPLFDVVFPVVHGTLCEDGTLQGLLELAGLPYVGSGVLSSAIGMDKDISKRLVRSAGICVTPFLTIKSDEWLENTESFIKLVSQKI